MRFHLPAIPHTRPTDEFSHCAFTTKARTFPRMIKHAMPDAEVIWYGVEGDEGHGIEGVDSYKNVLESHEWAKYFARQVSTDFVGNAAHVDHEGYKAFNAALSVWWSKGVQPGDFVCYPFGHAHQQAMVGMRELGNPHGIHVETGIGYPNPFLDFRIYESQAWANYVAGRQGIHGSDYHFVAPAWFDIKFWDSGPDIKRLGAGPVVYVGRLTEEKGIRVIQACAEAMPDVEFVVYGQGNAAQWRWTPNFRYGGVLDHSEVRDVFRDASCALFPTRYIEPFCQAHIEALLCGCHVVASDFGIFPETAVQVPGVFLARTLPAFAHKIRRVLSQDHGNRAFLHGCAEQVYGEAAVSCRYKAIFEQLAELNQPWGWYGKEYHHLQGATP